MIARQHKHAPWQKSVLIPFWTLQLLFLLAFIVLVVLSIRDLDSWGQTYTLSGGSGGNGLVMQGTNIIEAVWLSVSGACVTLTVAEIVLFAIHKLRPLAFLITSILKTTIWSGFFSIYVAAYVTARIRPSILGIVVVSVSLLCFWIPLIYGSVVFHKFRMDTRSYSPVNYTSYKPQSMSSASPYNRFVAVKSLSDITEATVEEERRLSYDHRRDTRFEAYKQGRNSFHYAHPNVTVEEVSPTSLASISEIPRVYVEDHDGERFEMYSGRRPSGFRSF